MSRYIDADDFIENSKKHYCDGCDDYNGVRCRACWVDDMCNEVDCTPTADVFEGVQRNEDFNRVIDELVEIEAKNDIGYFTSTERSQFNAYVEDLLSMTIERAEA